MPGRNCAYQDDTFLLKQLHGKDMGAFSFIFDAYSKRLFFYCRAILNTDQAAEDAVQDTMLTLWRHTTEFRSIVSLKTFLYQTAKNRSLDMLRHTQVENRHNMKAARELSESFLELKLIEEEVIAELHRRVDELPAECARIFRMSLKGMGNIQIADELGISVSTVKTQKQRAMAALRSHFGRLTPFVILLAASRF